MAVRTRWFTIGFPRFAHDDLDHGSAGAGKLTLAARTEGIFLDPTYTARALAGLSRVALLWQASDGDDDLSPGVPLLQVLDGLGCFA